MRKLIAAFLVTTSFVCSPFSVAEIAVIVNPSSGVTSLTDDQIAKIFLGKSNKFPGGDSAVPVNQDDSSPVREKFNNVICKKSASQYKAYWSQLTFTGKGTPPKDVGKDAAVKAWVTANANSIGYVDASAVDATVKVVYKLP